MYIGPWSQSIGLGGTLATSILGLDGKESAA
jgi:hypothetical protein